MKMSFLVTYKCPIVTRALFSQLHPLCVTGAALRSADEHVADISALNFLHGLLKLSLSFFPRNKRRKANFQTIKWITVYRIDPSDRGNGKLNLYQLKLI